MSSVLKDAISIFQDYWTSEPFAEQMDLPFQTPESWFEVDPSLSADENIKRMCFVPNGYLFRDFNDVFTSVFGANAPAKRRVLEALADSSMDGEELAERIGMARNGRLYMTGGYRSA